MTLEHDNAFPSFFIPVSSMAFGKSDPVVSMPYHTKFFLLRSLCNDALQSSSLVHDDDNLDVFKAALLTGQASLLDFGFQSKINKIKELLKPSAMLLEQAQGGPSDRRLGQDSASVVGIKRAVLEQFFRMADLRVNYRLALLLGEFKSKFQEYRSIATIAMTNSSKHKSFALGWASSTGDVEGHKLLVEWARGFEVYSMFEGLFKEELPRPLDDFRSDKRLVTKHDAHTLDFCKLTDKPDFEDALLETILSEDDQLMVRTCEFLNQQHLLSFEVN
jgi:hypothetical protein